MRARLTWGDRCSGEASPPGDKSISHRALMFSALAEGRTIVENLAPGADVRSTGHCMRALGAEIEIAGIEAVVTGVGGRGLAEPKHVLDCGNSGTTMRLLAGIVAGAGVAATMDGDASLRRRPMRRVLAPLREMGATCEGAVADEREPGPLRFHGGARLKGKGFALPTASAQVKSCILLAGLFAEGETSVSEPFPSRDHTERMLRLFGVEVSGPPVCARGALPLRSPGTLIAPGDFSSAAFVIAAAALIEGADVRLTNVNLNPRRTGFLRTLAAMGADIAIENAREACGEPVGDVRVRGGARLKAIDLGGADVPDQIDEVTLLAIVATQAEGATTISGAQELRVKESDRLRQVARGLAAMGANLEEREDGLVIEGGQRLNGAHIDAAHDHRIAMGFAIAGLRARGETVIDGAEWADISFPGYFSLLSALTQQQIVLEP